MKFEHIILIATGVTTALMAGIFFAFSCSVSPGLARLSDPAYLTAMQSINRAILNPVFFLVFTGAALLLPFNAWLQFSQPASLRFWFLLLAAGVYLAGGLAVTIFGNIPLNDRLDALKIATASSEELAGFRAMFEGAWNNLNNIRSLMSVLAVLFFIIACLCPGKRDVEQKTGMVEVRSK